MTALHPTTQATGTTAIVGTPDSPRTRRRADVPASEVPAAAQLLAAIAGAACILAAIVFGGWPWASVPMGALAFGILLGAFLPDLLAARWDRQRQQQEDAEASE